MQKDEYMEPFRLGAQVTFRGIRYRCISAVVCRRMINKSQSMDAPRIYMELELLDNCGHSVTLANPRVPWARATTDSVTATTSRSRSS